MKELKFFVCTHCGNLAGMVYNSGVPMICCGEPMNAGKTCSPVQEQGLHIPGQRNLRRACEHVGLRPPGRGA